jgi:PKD repeat protein
VARQNAAAFAASDGSVLPWAPIASDAVTSLAISPTADKIVLGGVFRTLNGSNDPGQTMGAVDTQTGTTVLPWKINTVVPSRPLPATGDYAVYSLASDGEFVYGTMGPGAFEGTFKARWSDGDLASGWLADCMGDSYSVYPAGDVVYSANHAHNCVNIGDFPETRTAKEDVTPRTYKRTLAFTTAATGTVKKKVSSPGNTAFTAYAGQPAPTVLNWYPEFDTGLATGQGPWDITGAQGYVLVGGDFGKVNGVGQQGLARFAPKAAARNSMGPVLSGKDMTPTAVSRGGTGVAISVSSNYDYDNQSLRYDLERDGKVIATLTDAHRFWQRATLTFGDDDLVVGRTHSYRVRTTDPFGNSTLGDPVSYTATDGTMASTSAYDRTVLGDGPSAYWPFNEKSGSTMAFDRVGANDVQTTPTVRQGGIETPASGTSTAYPGGSTWSAATRLTAALPAHSQELWFRTTSKTGGELMGFASTRTQSGAVGRQLYMNAAGLVQYTPFAAAKTITSPSNVAYNDGRWHHAVATTGPGGSALYLDGKLVRSLATATEAQAFEGYWHVGGYTLTGMPGSRTSTFYTGSLDNVAVYPKVLDPATVAAHFAAVAAKPANTAPTAAFTSTVQNLTVGLDGSTSSDADGKIVTYAWNFGDGAVGSGATASHTFAAAGTYTVTLTVTDDAGATHSTSSKVTVAAAPSGALAADGFTRSTAGAWGSADTGGAWSLSGPAGGFSTSGSRGVMTNTRGETRTALLPGVSGASSDSTVTFVAGQKSSAAQYVSVIGRQVGSASYSVRVVIQPDGKLQAQLFQSGTLLGRTRNIGTYAAGQTVNVRFQVAGAGTTTLSAKVWTAGGEPAAWQVTAQDTTAALQAAGAVGLKYYTGSTGLTTVVSFDGYRVAAVK